MANVQVARAILRTRTGSTSTNDRSDAQHLVRDRWRRLRWQPHSLRGFLSGTVGNKTGLTLALQGADLHRGILDDVSQLASIFRGLLSAIDNENFNRAFLRFEPKAELFLKGGEQRRVLRVRRWAVVG